MNKKILLLPILVLTGYMNAQIGIKTSNPTATLDVNGTVRVRDLPEVYPTDFLVFADYRGMLTRSDITYEQLKRAIMQSANPVPTVTNTPVYAYVEDTDSGITSRDNSPKAFSQAPLYQSPAGVMNNGVFTAPSDGVYLVSSRVPMVQTITGPDAAIRSKLLLMVNGKNIAAYENSLVLKQGFFNLSEVQFSRIVKLSAGDTLNVAVKSARIGYVTYNAPGSLRDQGYPYLSIIKVN